MLGDPGTHNSSILGSINLPIFNAGALRAQVEQRDAQVQAANARYEAALLTGIQEIEDALNDIWAVQQRIKSLQVAVESAKRAATNARQELPGRAAGFYGCSYYTKDTVDCRGAIGPDGG